MKSWAIALKESRRGEFKFKVLIEIISREIETGQLPEGKRLPSQRKVAKELGISTQTITNVYKKLKQQGLIRGGRGRGSFVAKRVTENICHHILDYQCQTKIDLSTVTLIRSTEHDKCWKDICGEMTHESVSPWIHACRPIAGIKSHRQAAAHWLSQAKVDTNIDNILITNGCLHAITLALSTIAGSNDIVLCEQFTDHGIIGLSKVLGFTLKGVEIDQYGIVPDHFEELCDDQKITALVCTPNMNNPTSSIMPEIRRKQIAEIAKRYCVYIIENDVFGALLGKDKPTPISSYIPELSFYCTSFTKIALTGIRIGYLVIPSPLILKTNSILRVTGWMTSPILSEIATRLINSGWASYLVDLQIKLIRKRQKLVVKYFDDYLLGDFSQALSCWLKIPDHWQLDALIEELKNNNVVVTSPLPFLTDDAPKINAIRICIGANCSHENFEKALIIIKEVFEKKI